MNEKLTIITLVVLSVLEGISAGGSVHKKIKLHVPVKVKHHHHVHTVYKTIHHTVPVPIYHHHDTHHDTHHDIHVIHENRHNAVSEDNFDTENYHETIPEEAGHGRHMIQALDPHEGLESAGDYLKVLNIMKKRAKKQSKTYNNDVIGWRGRKGYDKIAAEFLSSLKDQPHGSRDDSNEDNYSVYEDENWHENKR